MKVNQLCKLALAIGMALGTSVITVQAAESTETNTNTTQNIETINILGSRVSSRTSTESTSPIDIIASDTLTEGGFTELGQSLQATAPSFNFSRTQVSDGSDLFRPATLRGMQPDQTLVLVNGKRRHNQSIFGNFGTVGGGAAGTDMNAIPLTALKNVQVLRDGAAAQYGSDAIAGVINLSLKDSTNITTGFIQAGQTEEGDGDTITLGLNTGFDLTDDGGFINLSLEYRDADGTNRAQRDIGGSSTIPAGTLSEEVRWKQGNADSEFQTIFYNMMIPVGEAELYSFGGYSNRTALGNGFYRNFDEADKNVQQVYPDGFLPNIDNESDDTSVAIGIRGEVNDIWSYDVSGVYGKNSYDFFSSNTINPSYAAEYVQNYPDASDSDILDNSGAKEGYSGGYSFDQLTFNADISGEVDINLANELYVSFGIEYREENYQISQGEEASYACGISNQDISFPSVIDPTVFATCGFQAFNGIRPDAATKEDRDSYAIYLDLENQITDKWLVGTALRYENFSDSGNDLIGKLSTRYEVNDDLSIRGSVSTGFRAPSLQQSAYTAYTTNLGEGGSLETSYTANSGADFPSALGISELKLETSESLGLGFVYNATDEITITLDAYHTEIKDRITASGFLKAEDLTFSPEATAALEATGAVSANYFSNAVDLTTKGIDLIVTYQTTINEGKFGITFAGNFNDTEIDSVNSPEGIPSTVTLDNNKRDFITDSQPHERGTLSFDYEKGDWSTMIRANYFGETEVSFFANNHIGLPDFLSSTGSFQPTSVVEAATLIDVNVDYKISDALTFSLGINNLFNVTPDELADDEALEFISNKAFQYPLRAVPYGFDGMSYYARIGFAF
ncbi:TonB-dependent receptor plug domain-containing protein [Pseudocolwellia sp. HL-MZ19]|uniref:TonB-dependent receptor plug domain-containing protein n=1 Tax=Pseudocolwellia sp. HL-MZ19 TaxID=3400846 RepID=UPI003CF52998